jgi:hypothetical protein
MLNDQARVAIKHRLFIGHDPERNRYLPDGEHPNARL